MSNKLIIILWVVLTVSIVYFHIKSVRDHIPLSVCHLAEVQWYYDKPMCTECKLFCDIKK